MRINVITLFPDILNNHFQYLPFKRALEKNLIELNVINLREYALDNYGTVDGKPYGGGTGMLLRIEPIYNALKDLGLAEKKRKKNSKVILTTPTGEMFTQKKAESFSKLKEITLLCGRYEGVDARISNFVDESISIGDYVLSGGELAALALMEATVRLIPGVIEKSEATSLESFSKELSFNNGEKNKSLYYEYPQYTRPEDFMGMKVPKELLSGNHKKIQKWKIDNIKALPKKD